MTPEERALRDAFLAELWKPCPELSRRERLEKREEDAVKQALICAQEKAS